MTGGCIGCWMNPVDKQKEKAENDAIVHAAETGITQAIYLNLDTLRWEFTDVTDAAERQLYLWKVVS